MAFDDFGNLFEERFQPRHDFVLKPDADEGGDLKAYLFGIDLGAVAHDDPRVLHLVNPLHNRRGRQPDPPPEFGVGEPRVFLQFFEQTPADVVQKFFVVRTHIQSNEINTSGATPKNSASFLICVLLGLRLPLMTSEVTPRLPSAGSRSLLRTPALLHQELYDFMRGRIGNLIMLLVVSLYEQSQKV